MKTFVIPDDWAIGIVTKIGKDHDGPFAHVKVFKSAQNAEKPQEPWLAKGTHVTVSLRKTVYKTRGRVSEGSIIVLWDFYPKGAGWRVDCAERYGKQHEDSEVGLTRPEWTELNSGEWVYLDERQEPPQVKAVHEINT